MVAPGDVLRESQIDPGHIHVKTEKLMHSNRNQPRVNTKVGGACCDSLNGDLRSKLRKSVTTQTALHQICMVHDSYILL